MNENGRAIERERGERWREGRRGGRWRERKRERVERERGGRDR